MARIWLEYPMFEETSKEYCLREQHPYQDGYSLILEGDNGECLKIHAHDNDGFNGAQISLEFAEGTLDLKLKDLMFALAAACGRRVVFREHSGHILGFGTGLGPHTLWEAAKDEDIPDKYVDIEAHKKEEA